jgi:hypothetical protein
VLVGPRTLLCEHNPPIAVIITDHSVYPAHSPRAQIPSGIGVQEASVCDDSSPPLTRRDRRETSLRWITVGVTRGLSQVDAQPRRRRGDCDAVDARMVVAALRTRMVLLAVVHGALAAAAVGISQLRSTVRGMFE